MKWTVFCNAEDDFHLFVAFLQKSHLELNCTKHFFGASKNTNSVLVQLSNYENARPRCQQLFLSQKKLAKCNLRAKLKYMKNVSFYWNELFFARQKTYSLCLSFFAEKVI